MLGLPFQAYYSARQVRARGFAEALAEVQPFGISVTIVEPGNVRTGFTDSRRQAPSSAPYASANDSTLAVMENDSATAWMPARSSRLCIACYMRATRRGGSASAKLDERFGPWPSGSCPTASSKEWRAGLWASDCPCPISSEAQRCTMDGPPACDCGPKSHRGP